MLFSLKSRKKEDKKAEDKLHEVKRKNSKMEDFDDDLDFNETPIRRSDTRSDRKQDVSLDFISDFSSEFIETSATQPPPRARKTAGWSDGTPGKKSWLRRGSMNFLRESPKKEIIMDTSPVNSGEIPVIPDLDAMKEEELSADVAKAPSLTVSRIATYQELDSDLSKHSAFQSLDGIDLSLLTKRLLPEHLVKKEDETPWTWDTLFADVSSHFNSTTSTDYNESTGVDKIGDQLDKIL
ncbi:intraflagellar transport protein 43 homolog B [Trichonephila clavata]|uniref:Intraflagellar transport protein 43 homolog B n=1 Tax=Trichonephila clavata TaxID=2740835 RepID=A0A8X6FQI8_TRICU|nr:intraflagellar transport protein 43 homolog B [Trichonephila clavata]